MPKDDMQSLLDHAKEHIKKGAAEKEAVLSPAPRPTVPRPRPALPPGPDSAPESSPESAPVFDPREAVTRELPRPRVPAPVDVSMAELAGVTPSLMVQAARLPLARMLIIIAASSAAVTGVVAAVGAAAVNVITALRPASNAEIRTELDAVKVRVNGDFGMKLETETRQKKDAELEKKIEDLSLAQQKLAASIPNKVKVRVNPKPAADSQ
jgi:hypothetical protein